MCLSKEELQIEIENVFKYLDNIDLKEYLIKYKFKDIHYLMRELEEKFPYNTKNSDGLFDLIDQDEFITYIENKYKVTTREVSYMEIINIPK